MVLVLATGAVASVVKLSIYLTGMLNSFQVI